MAQVRFLAYANLDQNVIAGVVRREARIDLELSVALNRTDFAASVSLWYEQIAYPTLADGILDRPVHNAHHVEMHGDSMRKNRTKPPS